MKKGLIIAAIAIAIGCGLFAGAMTMVKWDFTKLSTQKFVTNTHTLDAEFADIVLTADTAKVTILPAADDKVTVECYEYEYVQHAVTVQDGTLKIERQDTRRWYHYIGVSFSSPQITVYLPSGDYDSLAVKSSTGGVTVSRDVGFKNVDIALSTGDVTYRASATGDVKIGVTTGDIAVEKVSAASLSLSATTGRITVTDVTCTGDVTAKVATGDSCLTNVTCRNYHFVGTTGDIVLTNVIAAKKGSIERDTGDVTLHACDAAELRIKTTTGDVMGNLLSEKVFIANSDTGRVDVQKTVTGGRCEIATTTGNIQFTIV